MPNSYLFYDLETSGLNKCFDQVLQFAAIRTDLNLNEIDRHEIFIKLNPDVVPSPTAILVNGISLDKIQDGKCEHEAIKKIHELFNTPGTISVGYNSLGFDDEFLRFSFYRNLLAPYTHQYANDCGRMDLYPMAVIYYLFKPDIMDWPKIDGAPTLRLEHLSRQNNLMKGAAHNAMNDVVATLGLARLLKKEEKMWEYLCGAFNKKTDLARLNKLSMGDEQRTILIDGSLGGARFYQSVVVGLGTHSYYKNQSLWLPVDNFSLAGINRDNISEKTFASRKRFGESPILLPFTKRFTHHLSDERLELMEENIDWLRKNQGLFLEISDYYKNYQYPEIPGLDIDAALYQVGFRSDQDQMECSYFQSADSEAKIDLVDRFFNTNSRTQAIRILGRNYVEVLAKNKDLYQEFASYLKKVRSGSMVNYKNEVRMSPQAALAEIEVLSQTRELSKKEKGLLEELAKYIQSY